MFNKYYLSLSFLVLVFVSCDKVPDQVSQKEDYDKYLREDTAMTVEKIKRDHAFWEEKLMKDSTQFPYLVQLASAQTNLFGATGEIEYLIQAERNLAAANQKTGYRNVSYLKSLARNYIAQHRFSEALSLLKSAEALGEKINGTYKMLFDVHMELGNYETAETYLKRIEDRSDFDFLLRYAKWSDHKGDLSTAITYMEKATEKAELMNLKGLRQWSYTNLADFYGHNGEIQRSYEHYLKALELDPNDAYAKKGIAWIVYSHERNPQEALRILNSITTQYKSPDYHLLKAEIAEFMNKGSLKKRNLEDYFATLSNENYGVMYNTSSAILYAEEFEETAKAMSLAQLEVEQRSTPQSYDLLAWIYYKQSDYKKALEIAEEHVVNRTFEPEALYHLAMIYKAAGKMEEAQKLKKELQESLYELGPVAEREIRQI
ncbi:tetratricopeptide repeat protein [Gramella sp. KN1008]|uniref:tetratricopeptide repeat protein n=1 Tax=Gramella sp. KN1008 TaxID=2529298 RepID=UPI001038E240|nr:tetratricopeptide repeat protein [Gramella sp. KN1008]TBW30239.1 cell surface protein [Gramella sp. KN1008]